MKKEKLIESWKDLALLLVMIILGLAIIYALFFTSTPESAFTTGYWKGVEGFIKSL